MYSTSFATYQFYASFSLPHFILIFAIKRITLISHCVFFYNIYFTSPFPSFLLPHPNQSFSFPLSPFSPPLLSYKNPIFPPPFLLSPNPLFSPPSLLSPNPLFSPPSLLSPNSLFRLLFLSILLLHHLQIPFSRQRHPQLSPFLYV